MMLPPSPSQRARPSAPRRRTMEEQLSADEAKFERDQQRMPLEGQRLTTAPPRLGGQPPPQAPAPPAGQRQLPPRPQAVPPGGGFGAAPAAMSAAGATGTKTAMGIPQRDEGGGLNPTGRTPPPTSQSGKREAMPPPGAGPGPGRTGGPQLPTASEIVAPPAMGRGGRMTRATQEEEDLMALVEDQIREDLGTEIDTTEEERLLRELIGERSDLDSLNLKAALGAGGFGSTIGGARSLQDIKNRAGREIATGVADIRAGARREQRDARQDAIDAAFRGEDSEAAQREMNVAIALLAEDLDMTPEQMQALLAGEPIPEGEGDDSHVMRNQGGDRITTSDGGSVVIKNGMFEGAPVVNTVPPGFTATDEQRTLSDGRVLIKFSDGTDSVWTFA